MPAFNHEEQIVIRHMKFEDIGSIIEIIRGRGWQCDLDRIESYYHKQQEGVVTIHIAEQNDMIAGYIVALPKHNPSMNIREMGFRVLDYCVFTYTNKTLIGNRLFDAVNGFL